MPKKNTQKLVQTSGNLGIPVVAVLGHVDHGKTSLLDAIRKTSIAVLEHGGITQRIGASSVEVFHEDKKRQITFIDTPGHEAFSKMRSRGATAANIGLLIVSSSEGIKPQTKESIQHLRVSKIPFIVVLTKSDLPDKNPEKVIGELAKEEVLVEGRGGDIPQIEVSAKTGHNIKELLELILLVFDLKVGAEKLVPSGVERFEAIVIESKRDIKRGSLATVIIKKGNLKIKDEITSGKIHGRVKALITDKREKIQKAEEGEGVEILGFEDPPVVGEMVYKKSDAQIKQVGKVEKIEKAEGKKSLFFMSSEASELSIIVCAETEGALEAITASLPKEIKVILKKTGEVTEADVLLAKSTGAILVSFNKKIRNEVQRLAQVERVLLKNYTVIYELLDEVKDALEGKQLSLQEQIFGSAVVLASFPFEKTKVLGIRVTEGRVARGDKVRLIRGEEVIGESTITSVRIGKEQTSKVEKGKECGIIIAPVLDFTIGDMLLCHD
ncbi:MAG: hypothetical protein A3G13_01595 [Candidatus Levybacteria bacterium RIFCSPLOWO2_12_FULL_37_7]|nr:MAG: hypothetical protein A3G13_01595 [Candidatus Levybacteria bacterium RIFCSPLOWO2_12_FULL_37_7]